jgi:GDP-L-fucose synthase
MTKKVFVAGHGGMVGQAIVRLLAKYDELEIVCKSRAELDLTSSQEVKEFFQSQDIDQVYLAAAKVGGIQANMSYPAEFLYENLMIASNVIHEAHKAGVQHLLFLGSSSIYPKDAEQPMREDALLSGRFEPTNEPYSVAKIAGIKLCESYNRQYGRDYRSIIPANLYGQNDTFNEENSHVIPSLIRRIEHAHRTKKDEVTVWGSGNPLREFLHVDDMASACKFLMEAPREKLDSENSPSCSHINAGVDGDVSIRQIAELIAKSVGFTGELQFDSSKPDGVFRKFMNSEKMARLGWHHQISLEKGLKETVAWYRDNLDSLRE